MMKKVLLVVLTLALATSLSLAQTSGPSNTAGFTKTVCNGTTVGIQYATPFGLAFKFWDVDEFGVPTYGSESTKPSDIVGDQTNPGDVISADQILKQASGDYGYRTVAGDWLGDLEVNESMEPGRAYWYLNKSGAPRNLVLAGEVDNAGNYGGVFMDDPPAVPANGQYATPYSWRDSRNVILDSLDLLNQGFTGGDVVTSDKILEQGTGLQANYLTATPGWDYGGAGTPFMTITPSRAYWILNRHVGNEWTYTYVGVPVLPMTANDNEGVVTGTSKSPTSKSKASVRATTSVKKSAPKTGKTTVKNSK
ncbi:hypothetical protein EH220_05310 [bacterium]|nr:MAG: hypothetical protein EH220_05310 [bacterium]